MNKIYAPIIDDDAQQSRAFAPIIDDDAPVGAIPPPNDGAGMLTGLGTAVGNTFNDLSSGYSNRSAATIRGAQIAAGVAPENMVAIPETAAPEGPQGFLAKAYTGLTRDVAPGIAAAMTHGGLPGAGIGAAAGLVAGAPTVVGEAATLPIGTAAGFGYGTTAAFASQGASDIYQAAIDAGVDPETARYAGVAASVPYAALEKLQLGIAAKPFVSMIAKDAAKVGIDNVTPKLAQRLVQRAVKYGVAGAQETGTEALQKGVEQLGVAGGQAYDGTGNAGQTLANIPGAMYQEAKDVAGTMFLVPLPGHVAGGVADVMQGQPQPQVTGTGEVIDMTPQVTPEVPPQVEQPIVEPIIEPQSPTIAPTPLPTEAPAEEPVAPPVTTQDAGLPIEEQVPDFPPIFENPTGELKSKADVIDKVGPEGGVVWQSLLGEKELETDDQINKLADLRRTAAWVSEQRKKKQQGESTTPAVDPDTANPTVEVSPASTAIENAAEVPVADTPKVMTWQEMKGAISKSDAMEKQEDDYYDELIAAGVPEENALRHPVLEKIIQDRVAVDDTIVNSYSSIINDTLKNAGINKQIFTTAESIAQDVYGANLFMMDMYKTGQKAFENQDSTVQKLTQLILKNELEQKGLDPEGTLGRDSGLTKAGKQKLIDDATRKAEKIHAEIMSKLGMDVVDAPPVKQLEQKNAQPPASPAIPADQTVMDSQQDVALGATTATTDAPANSGRTAADGAEAQGVKQPWEMTASDIEARYPVANGPVDGRTVGGEVKNLSSIDSSIDNSSELDGIREVSIASFEDNGPPKFYSATEEARTRALAEEIKNSGRIDPLIVVDDGKASPYILEGGHRFDALRLLGAKSFPAKVVVDEGAYHDETKQAISRGETIPPAVQAEYPDLFPPVADTPTSKQSLQIAPTVKRDLKVAREESVQEQSRREASENAAKVSADPTKASSKDIRRAFHLLDQEIRHENGKESPNEEKLRTLQEDRAWYKRILAERETPPRQSATTNPTSPASPQDHATAVRTLGQLNRAAMGPTIKVVKSGKDIPGTAKITSSVQGAYDEANDIVYVASDDLVAKAKAEGKTVQQATRELWFHECGLHRGIAFLFPDAAQRQKTLQAIHDAVGRDVLLAELGDAYPQNGMPEAAYSALLAEEHLAKIAERTEGQLTALDKRLMARLIQAVRNVLRKVGIVRSYTDADVRAFVREAMRGVSAGHASGTDLRYSASVGDNARMDKEYLDAVSRGDMDTAQRMVDEAAKRAGYNTKPLWNGTESGQITNIDRPFWLTENKSEATAYSEITDMNGLPIRKLVPSSKSEVVMPDKLPTGPSYMWIDGVRKESQYITTNTWPIASDFDGEPFTLQVEDGGHLFYWNGKTNPYGDNEIVFISDKMVDETTGIVSTAKADKREQSIPDSYKPYVGRYYISGNFYKDESPLFQKKGTPSAVNAIGQKLGGTQELADEWKAFLKKGNYDGIKTVSDDGLMDGRTIEQYAIFNPSSVKSADPVTYNDNGKPIPLSQRFQTANPDIRYSITQSQAEDFAAVGTGGPERRNTATQANTDLGRTAANEVRRYYTPEEAFSHAAMDEHVQKNWTDADFAALRTRLALGRAEEALDIRAAKIMADRDAAEAFKTGRFGRVTETNFSSLRQGTVDARKLSARQDDTQTPMERWATAISFGMTDMPKPVRKTLNDTMAQIQSILKANPELMPEYEAYKAELDAKIMLAATKPIKTAQELKSEKQVRELKRLKKLMQEAWMIQRTHSRKAEKLNAELKANGLDLDAIRRGLDGLKAGDMVDSKGFPIAVVKKALDANRIVRTRMATWGDMVHEAFIANILSGITTNAINLSSTGLHGAYELTAKRTTEAMVNMFAGKADAAQLGELPAVWAALISPRNLNRAFIHGWNAFQTETPAFAASVMALQSENKSIFDFSDQRSDQHPNQAIPGKIGRFYRLHLRALLGFDEFFKALFGQADVVGQAYRIAKQEGLSGAQMTARIEALSGDLSSTAWGAAMQTANRTVFQEQLSDNLSKFSNMAGGNPILKYIIPFRKTPLNLFKQAIHHLPVVGTAKLGVDMYKGMGESEMVRRIAEQLIGTAVTVALANAMLGDDDEPWITGTVPYKGTTKGERELAQRIAPAQSIKIGGEWYSYARLDPFSTILSSLADGLATVRALGKGQSAEGAYTDLFAKVSTAIMDKTFLRGLGDMFSAVRDPREAQTWAIGFGTAFVPWGGFVRGIGRSKDDFVRDSKGDGMAVVSQRGLGMSDAPPKVNLWGEPVKKFSTGSPQTDFVFRLLSPVNVEAPEQRLPRARQLDLMLLKYNLDHPDQIVAPQTPQRYLEQRGKRYDLTDDQYAKFSTMAGEWTLRRLTNMHLNIEKPSERDIERVQKAIEHGRELAKRRMIIEIKRSAQ